MDAKIKQLALTLTVMVFLLSYIFANMEVVYSNNTYGEIDLFTQKEPYSGKGPNIPSDAFGPGEIVILYALVIYNGEPLQNLLVTFFVQSPDGTSFTLTASINASGIAAIDFTIPQKCLNETEVFGEWFTSANVLIGINVFQDKLTFDVDWIVKLISIRTIDENLVYQSNFGIGGDVGLEIALRNIAMCMKSTMLAIVIKDETGVPINYSGIRDFDVPPGEKLVFLYCKLSIPKWARPGKASVNVSALTAPVNQSGVLYCPAISTDFSITIYEPLTITLHDVAVVDVAPSATLVELGQFLNVSIMVRNEGTEIENFNVSAYFDSTLIGTLNVKALLPYSKVTLNFTLDTSSVGVENYTITASIPYLVNEADFTDNTFVDGVVEIRRRLPSITHDIAVVDVNISNNSVYIGDLLQINVSVVNKGTETETFNVTVYCDSSLIETLQVSALDSGAQATLIFLWNTAFASEGFYKVKASAPLLDDIDASDNIYLDGVVEVKAKPPQLVIHDVAVLNVTPSSTLIYIGENIDICVVVKNQGNYTESFNVTASYNCNDIETRLVENLEPNAEKTLVFHWNTQDVLEGNYILSAEASVVSEEFNIENNKFVDDVVWVRPWVFPAVWEIPRWLLALLFLLAIFIVACLVAAIIFWLLWRRERKKKDQMGRQPTYPSVEFKRSKTCSMCGKEFPGVYTFCPYCFTFHGKDYE